MDRDRPYTMEQTGVGWVASAGGVSGYGKTRVAARNMLISNLVAAKENACQTPEPSLRPMSDALTAFLRSMRR